MKIDVLIAKDYHTTHKQNTKSIQPQPCTGFFSAMPIFSLFTFRPMFSPMMLFFQMPWFSFNSNPTYQDYNETTHTFDSNDYLNFCMPQYRMFNDNLVTGNFPAPKLSVPKLSYSNAKRKTSYALRPSTETSLTEIAQIYNKDKGKKLAEKTIEGLNHAEKGYCARAVKTGIQNAGLGAYQSGHAKDMPDILSGNKNFKEVRVAASDIDKLPAGCVLCYEPGDCGYSRTYGHTTVTDGNSNGIHFQVDSLKTSNNVRVFVPV